MRQNIPDNMISTGLFLVPIVTEVQFLFQNKSGYLHCVYIIYLQKKLINHILDQCKHGYIFKGTGWTKFPK